MAALQQAIPEPVLVDNAVIDAAGLSAEDRSHRDTMGSSCPKQAKSERWTEEAVVFLREVWWEGERSGQHMRPETGRKRMREARVNQRRVFGPCCKTSKDRKSVV